jgi:hypothetical protein
MLSPEFIGGSEDPVALVECCHRAVEMLLATHTARGVLIPRPWVDAIDQAIEADQELQIKAHQAR